MTKWFALAALALLIVGVVAVPRIGREPAASAQPAGASTGPGQVRNYFIAADEVVWDSMVPDAAGTWLFHCHTGRHLLAGMVGNYVVQEEAGGGPTATGGLN